jgi:hypothetical protein
MIQVKVMINLYSILSGEYDFCQLLMSIYIVLYSFLILPNFATENSLIPSLSEVAITATRSSLIPLLLPLVLHYLAGPTIWRLPFSDT